VRVIVAEILEVLAKARWVSPKLKALEVIHLL